MLNYANIWDNNLHDAHINVKGGDSINPALNKIIANSFTPLYNKESSKNQYLPFNLN